MAITPADIEKKTFSTALRGYDLDEVDDFLDEMVVAVRELEGELAQARARIAELERDPNAPVAPVIPPPAPAVDESAVGRALVAAQQAADRMLDEARVEADQILEGARTEADTLARDRDQRKAEVEAEMAEMTQLVAGVRTKLAVLATTVADKLDEMDAVVAGEATEDAAEPEAGEEELAMSVDSTGAEGEEGGVSIDAAADVEMEPEAVEEPGEGEGTEDVSEVTDDDENAREAEATDTETSTEDEANGPTSE